MAAEAKQAEKKVLYRASKDEVSGVLADLLERQSARGLYLELVFASGETIQMPYGFRIPFDLVEGGTYSARWESGRFTIVEGSELPASETEAAAF